MPKPDKVVRVTIDVPMRWYGDRSDPEWYPVEDYYQLSGRVHSEAARIAREQDKAEGRLE